MINLFLPLLISLATSSTTAASLPKTSLGPSNPMNLTDLHYSNTTSPNDAGGIDPRFGVHYQLGSTPLPPIACLLNAVKVMSILALLDFNREIPPIVASVAAYPDVVIKSNAASSRAGTTPLPYILWGVWSVALFMMKDDVFRTILVTLGFNGVTVGYLRLERPHAQIMSLGGSNGESSAGKSKRRSDGAFPAISPLSIILQNSTMPSNVTSLILTDTTATPSNAGNLEFFFSPFGRHLSNQQFFAPILAALNYVARFSATSPVDGFMLRPADTNTCVEFRDFGTMPKTQAAHFEYQCVAKALWELSRHMALVGYWSEVKVVIQVDGASVGVGWIRVM